MKSLKSLIFIATAANKENVKITQKELEILLEQFFSKYSEEIIKSWNGDMMFLMNSKKS